MMMATIFYVSRCALFVALGIALALAGVHVMTWPGAVVWGLLLALSGLEGLHAVYCFRQGRKEGIRFAVLYLAAAVGGA